MAVVVPMVFDVATLQITLRRWRGWSRRSLGLAVLISLPFTRHV